MFVEIENIMCSEGSVCFRFFFVDWQMKCIQIFPILLTENCTRVSIHTAHRCVSQRNCEVDNGRQMFATKKKTTTTKNSVSPTAVMMKMIVGEKNVAAKRQRHKRSEGKNGHLQ